MYFAFGYDGSLGERDFVHSSGIHRFTSGAPLLTDFELEPRWFDHDLVRFWPPMLTNEQVADTGHGPPDGRAKVIE